MGKVTIDYKDLKNLIEDGFLKTKKYKRKNNGKRYKFSKNEIKRAVRLRDAYNQQKSTSNQMQGSIITQPQMNHNMDTQNAIAIRDAVQKMNGLSSNQFPAIENGPNRFDDKIKPVMDRLNSMDNKYTWSTGHLAGQFLQLEDNVNNYMHGGNANKPTTSTSPIVQYVDENKPASTPIETRFTFNDKYYTDQPIYNSDADDDDYAFEPDENSKDNSLKQVDENSEDNANTNQSRFDKINQVYNNSLTKYDMNISGYNSKKRDFLFTDNGSDYGSPVDGSPFGPDNGSPKNSYPLSVSVNDFPSPSLYNQKPKEIPKPEVVTNKPIVNNNKLEILPKLKLQDMDELIENASKIISKHKEQKKDPTVSKTPLSVSVNNPPSMILKNEEQKEKPKEKQVVNNDKSEEKSNRLRGLNNYNELTKERLKTELIALGVDYKDSMKRNKLYEIYKKAKSDKAKNSKKGKK